MGIILIPLAGRTGEKWLNFGGRIPFLGGILVAGLFFYFSQLFPEKTAAFPKIINLFGAILVGGVSIISLFTDLAIREVLILDHQEYWPAFGPFFAFWKGVFLLLIGSGLGLLGWKYKRATDIQKIQIKYFFTGAALSIIAAVTTNLLVPTFVGPSTLWQYGPLTLIFSMVFTTYGITKHHLMNLKIVATELLVGAVLVILLIDVLLSETLLAGLFKMLILIAFGYLGISLIRSVLQEIRRREKIEKMSRQLKKAYQELKKLDEAKSEFIAMASHQLRTPLTIIKGNISMLREGTYGEPPERFKRPLKDVFDSNERLIRIINDLLNISKIELGKIELSKQKIQLEDLIEEILQEFKVEAQKKGLYLKWKRPKEPLPMIEVDSLKIRQVISCVVDNAIRYTQKGGVSVKLETYPSKLVTVVSDTGAGMTKEETKRIFESFTRGEAGINLWVQGAGLGLYLAKRYIELHKGKIWAESPGKGKGSTFYIELPIK